jgi:NAD(P)-dependent dehydrogenase (short-subunit alcohol dehydrogenase family)
MDLQLSGKAALVTGGSRGIGKAIARSLALEGCDVAIVARGLEALEKTAQELANETGRRIVPVAGDTGDEASVTRFVAEAVNQLGRLDILVNNAAVAGGQGAPPSLAEISEEVFWADVNVKVLGYVRCAKAAAPHMTRGGWGRIINIGGLAARSAGSTITSMRNVAIVALTKNLAEELGPQGINVTCVHPGGTVTERTTAEAAQRMAEGTTVRRAITAENVAHVVTFLASPLSIAVTGDLIPAGGGVNRSIYY